MGGFWSTLGTIGEGVGEGLLQNAQKKSPMLGGVYQSFRNKKKPDDLSDANASLDSLTPGMGAPTGGDPTAGIDAMQGADQAAGLGDLSKPNAGAAASMANTVPEAADAQAMGTGQWNQPSQSSGGSGLANAAMMMGFDKGTIVTKPTIAKLAEHGQAEAVIPLTPKAGNRMQPDILEGRITPPKVPGVKYSRYSSYNRLGPHQGGALA